VACAGCDDFEAVPSGFSVEAGCGFCAFTASSLVILPSLPLPLISAESMFFSSRILAAAGNACTCSR
jgi:hypothetical protein